jgi:hypothetical protein
MAVEQRLRQHASGGRLTSELFRIGGTGSLTRLPVDGAARHQSRLVRSPSALAGFLDEIGDMPLDLQPTEPKIRSAPRSPTRLRSFMWAKA